MKRKVVCLVAFFFYQRTMHGDAWKNQWTEDLFLDVAVDDGRKNSEVWFPFLRWI